MFHSNHAPKCRRWSSNPALNSTYVTSCIDSRCLQFPRLAGIHSMNQFASLISIASLDSNFLGLVLPLSLFNVFPASKMMSLLFPHSSLTVYALKKKIPLLPSGRNMYIQSAMLNHYSFCETSPSLLWETTVWCPTCLVFFPNLPHFLTEKAPPLCSAFNMEGPGACCRASALLSIL